MIRSLVWQQSSRQQRQHTSLRSAIQRASTKKKHTSLLVLRPKAQAYSNSRKSTTSASASLFQTVTSTSSRHSQHSKQTSWFQWYSQRLDSHPIRTKCVSAGLIATVGNLLAQTIENEKKDYDWSKVGRFAVLNVVFVGTYETVL